MRKAVIPHTAKGRVSCSWHCLVCQLVGTHTLSVSDTLSLAATASPAERALSDGTCYRYQASGFWQGHQVVPAEKFQPLSIPSSNSSKMVWVSLVLASMFSVCNAGTVFQEKTHLCAYKMCPLRLILSTDKNIFHEVSLVLSVWLTALHTDASLWITSSAS